MIARSRGRTAVRTFALAAAAGALLTLGMGPAGAEPVPQPYLDVWYEPTWEPPATNEVTAQGFDEGTSVSFALSKDGTTTCLQSATVQDGAAAFDAWQDEGLCNPQPGDLLSATGQAMEQAVTKELVVQPSRSAGGDVGADADTAADVVSGVVPAGSGVELTTDEFSWYQAAVENAYAIDLSPDVDVQPWSQLGIAVFDADGDVVRIRWRVSRPVVEVVPDSELVDGQVVSVAGTGFTPGLATLAQGHGFIGGIDESTYADVPVAADGTLAATLAVRRVVRVPTGPEHVDYVDVNCAGVDPVVDGLCFVVAMDADGSGYYVDTAFRRPFAELAVAPLVSADRVTGRATLRGSLDCDPSDTAVISGTLRQVVGRRVILGTFALTVPCTQSHWSVVVQPSGRTAFVPGLARVQATATVAVWSDTAMDTVDRLVLVVRAPGR